MPQVGMKQYDGLLQYAVQSWSELLAPLVNMINGSENKPALILFIFFFFFYHKNLTFH